MKRASFVTCVNNEVVYRENVLKSTEPYADRIEYIRIDNPPSASRGLNKGLRKATEDIIVCCHQDIFFLDNWLDKMFEQLELLSKCGVCGCAGSTDNGLRVGTHSGLKMGKKPIKVQTLDGSLLILNKKDNLFFDEGLLFFHMYDVDIALQAMDRGLNNYVIYAPILHNTKGTSGVGIVESIRYVQEKWKPKVEVIYTTVGTL